MLYALIYAAAGSLVSRAEDLQVLALPLSLIAIVGYIQAVMALTGGIGPLVRFASYVPFWSPFVMLTRLTDRPGGAVGARPVVRPAHRDDPDRRASSPSACTPPACSCTASGPAPRQIVGAIIRPPA